MGEIEQLLQSAWASIKPKLLADPDELRRRQSTAPPMTATHPVPGHPRLGHPH
jgi:hypothetical protein